MRNLAFFAAIALMVVGSAVPTLADPPAPGSPPTPGAAPKPDDEVIQSLTPERLVSILQDLGYRANVQTFGENNKSKDVRTGMDGYRVSIYFFDCDASYNCTSIQYEATFANEFDFTLSRINKYNATKRYSRLYISPDDGSLTLDYDLFIDGMTMKSFKESVTLFENIIGNFKKFAQ